MVDSIPPVDSQPLNSTWFGTWALTVLLLLIAVGVYFQAWADVWPYWENESATYTHGPLVTIVSVWMIWRARLTVNQIGTTPCPRMLPVIIVLSAVWIISVNANIFILYVVLWPLLAFSALWAGFGLTVAYQFAPPLGFLYFAIPIWDYLKPPLQAITSKMVGVLTHVFGIPAALEGSYVTLPTATLFIADDCSGAHFLCIALAVGVLAGVIRRDTLRTRILILIIAGLLSMAFNWLRILLIVLAYLHPSMKGAIDTMEGHLTLGWWVFALDLLVFALILRFVPRASMPLEETRLRQQNTSIQLRSRTGTRMAVLALVALPAIAWTLPRFDSFSTETPSPDLGLSRAGSDIVSPDLRWIPQFPGTVWEGRFAIMTDTGVVIEVYSNLYHKQTQGSELISRASYLFDPTYFTSESSETIDLHNSEDQTIRAHRDILTDSAGTSWLATYTYFVDNEPIANSRLTQVTVGLRSIFNRTTAGIVGVATPCVKDCTHQVPNIEDAFVHVVGAYQYENQESGD